MCMFILCFLACAIAFRDKKIRHFVIFGILSGLLINIRIMGIVIPAVVTGLALVDILFGENRKKTVNRYILYLLMTAAVVVATWPWLWEDPVGRFRIAFVDMSKFRWDNNVLMNGDFVRASKVGWKYLPQWFGYTTPLVYLFFGISGILALVIHFLKKPADFIRNSVKRNQLIYLACFAGPVIAVIGLHSVLYDSWRQMYFIYPAFLLLAVYGIYSLAYSELFTGDLLITGALTLIFIISFGVTGSRMIKSHPYEDVYFNNLLSRNDQYLRKAFELDYWGTSYRKAFEFIAARDSSPVLNIRVGNLAGEHNLMILKPEDRKRIRLVESDAMADYFISNYRWHPQDYPYPKEKKIFSITVLNSEICSAWKLK
jgi:hypothetical protein